ncbi:MAG: FecR family protein, partial [Phenylobacterium sp.]
FLLRAEAGSLSRKEDARLHRWLAADPAHRSAYEAVLRGAAAADRASAHPELCAMRDAALRVRAPSRPWAPLAAAGAASLAVLGALAAWPPGPAGNSESPRAAPALPQLRDMLGPARAEVFATKVGERASLRLPDGSVALLDTDSRLVVRYEVRRRRVELERGQALFDVSKDPARPFEVAAGDRVVTAIGTRFSVRRTGAGLRVALLEGVVRVAGPAGPAPAQSVTLQAGEVLDSRPAAPLRVTTADTEKLTAWRSGLVVFSDTPLSEALAEMNRYSRSPVALEAAAELRVTGVFQTSQPDRFAKAMTEIFPLELVERPSGDLVLREKREDARPSR